MQKYDIHVCLISAQAAPNLLPILDTQFKPKKAIFIVSEPMKEKAKFLANTFEKKGVKTEQLKIEDEFNFTAMENQLIDLVSQYENESIALNVTGGTKLMAIAAQNAFVMKNKPIFYIDSDSNHIIFITRNEKGERIADLAMNAKIKLDTYLEAYGNKVIDESNPKENEQWIELSKEFILKYDFYKECIPSLNYHFSNAEGKNLKSEFDIIKSNMDIVQFFKTLNNIGIIKFNEKEIDFMNEQHHKFLGGGWLEDYTYSLLKDIKGIDDIRCNLNVANDKFTPKEKNYSAKNLGNQNEFDVAFLAKNKLHIIECKSQKMERQADIKSDHIVYKLEALKDYGGIKTKKCLISYFEVPQAVLNRAKTLNIKIIHGKDLQRMKSIIQDWIAR